MSRSSAARSCTDLVLEDAIEVRPSVDEHVGVFGFEPLARVDTAPGDTDREEAGRPRRLDVEGRVADVGRLGRLRTKALEREQQGLGVGLVALCLVSAHHGVEEMAERNLSKGK